MPAAKNKSFAEHYMRGLRTSTKHNTPAYGYSIVTGSTFAAITNVHGAPTLGEIFAFIVGTGLAFAAVNIVSTGGFRVRMPSEPPVVVALGTTFSIVPITVSAAAGVGVAYLFGGLLAWGIGAFAFTLVYLLVVALQLGLAARAHPRGAQD
jgi:hypothetical protein